MSDEERLERQLRESERTREQEWPEWLRRSRGLGDDGRPVRSSPDRSADHRRADLLSDVSVTRTS